MAAWMNVALADIERGLRNPDDGLVIEIFAMVEKHTGIPRVELFTAWIASMIVFILFGFASEPISILIALTHIIVFIYRRMINPESKFRLPKLTYLMCVFVLAESFFFVQYQYRLPMLLSVFYHHFKKFLQVRFFFQLSYRPVFRAALKNPGNAKGSLRERDIGNESLDQKTSTTTMIATVTEEEEEAMMLKEEQLANFFTIGLQGQWNEYKNSR